MAKSVTLPNGRTWKTQTAAKAHFKDMLGRYRNGHQITDPADHEDLQALLSVYDSDLLPGVEPKSGSGIKCFFRDKDREHGGTTDCFYVERIDSTKVDFSFHRAVEVASRKS